MEKEGFLMPKMKKGMLHFSSDRAGLYLSYSADFWGNFFILHHRSQPKSATLTVIEYQLHILIVIVGQAGNEMYNVL